MTGRRSSSAWSNRILIGSLTVLVLVVAVFLAYSANSGLPFVPTYDVNVQLPSAAGLSASDSVLIGGNRVGYIGSISSTTLADGRPGALLHLRLSESTPPLPVDSTDLVRPVSPLGLEYLQLTRGHAQATLRAGATIPVAQTTLPVQIDDLFDMFNAPTRAAATANLNAFGNAFAGRGADLNQTLYELRPFVDDLLPVTSDLLAPATRWAQLFPSLEQAAHEVVGVADQQSQLISALDETFTPLASATPALQASIVGGPPALQTATSQLPAQARFVDDTARLFARLHPAFVNLATASAQLSPAIAAGIPALHRAPALNDRLTTTLDAIERFAAAPPTLPGLVLLTDTAQELVGPITFIAPAQTSCNYLALFFRNLESALSESDSIGTMLQVVALPLPQLPNSEAGPASAPANGPEEGNTLQLDSYLHSDPYPNTDAPGQPAGCEAGNERYVKGRTVIGTAPISQRTTEQTKRVLP